MAVIMNNASYMGFPLSIKRGNPAPVDTTAVWYNKAELETYAQSGATAYVGQVLTLVADDKCEAFMISNEAGVLVKLASTTASGDLASDVATLQSQVADLISKVGKQAEGEEEATGLYALIATAQAQADKGVANAKTADDKAQSAQDDLDALEAVVGADDTTGLRKRIKANEDAIGVLNGSGEGSVDKKISVAIADVVGGAPDTFDTLKEISDWISTHGTEATGYANAISALEAILAGFGTAEGETATVKKYVDDAISALKIGDYAKASELTALAGRVSAVEAKPAMDITAEQIKAWDAKQDAGDFVEKGTYEAKMEELVDADTTNAQEIANVKATAEKAVVANTAITAGTATKITYDAKGLVVKGETLVADDIPTLGISKVDGLQDALDSKQANLTFDGTYNAGTNKVATVSTVNTAIDGVISNGADVASDNTIAGAKKYADQVAGTAETNAKSYADGLNTTADGRITALEGKVDVAKVSEAIATAKSEAITTAGTNADAKVASAKTAILGESAEGVDFDKTVKQAYDLANSKTTMAEVEAKGYAVATEVATAVADAKKAGTDAQASVKSLADKVGTVPSDTTVVDMIAQAKSEATYDDTALKARVKANEDAIGVLNGNETVAGSVAKQVADAVKAETDRAKEAEQTNATAISGVKSKVDAFLASAEVGDEAIDTLKEIQTYITSHGAEADTMVKNIASNKSAIEAEATRATAKEDELHTAISTEETRATTKENALQDAIDTLNGDDKVEGSVAKSVADAIAGLNISQYYTSAQVDGKFVAKVDGQRLMTDAEGEKLDGIASGAQVNVLEAIKVNGVAQTITAKAVDLAIPVADGTSIKVADNKLSVAEVSTDLLKQGVNTLVLNGGNASTLG